MARMADKHGLTNRYREAGGFKRNVRRGRPRKYLFGAPTQKRQAKPKAQTASTYVPPQREPVPFTRKNALKAVGIALGIFLLAALLIMWAAHKSGAV